MDDQDYIDYIEHEDYPENSQRDTRVYTCKCGRTYILDDYQDNPAYCPCEYDED